MLIGSILTVIYGYFHYRNTSLLGKLNRIILKQLDKIIGQGWLACNTKAAGGLSIGLQAVIADSLWGKKAI